METEDLICPMIASWVALPALVCFILALHFIVEIPSVLLIIISVILPLGSLLVAVFITISYKFEKLTLYNIAFYISLVFGIISALFVFGYMIGALIHFFRNFSELSFFPYFFKMSGVFFSGGIFAAMHFNVVGAKKQLESKDSLDDE